MEMYPVADTFKTLAKIVHRNHFKENKQRTYNQILETLSQTLLSADFATIQKNYSGITEESMDWEQPHFPLKYCFSQAVDALSEKLAVKGEYGTTQIYPEDWSQINAEIAKLKPYSDIIKVMALDTFELDPKIEPTLLQLSMSFHDLSVSYGLEGEYGFVYSWFTDFRDRVVWKYVNDGETLSDILSEVESDNEQLSRTRHKRDIVYIEDVVIDKHKRLVYIQHGT
jgi:hypothetical protein